MDKSKSYNKQIILFNCDYKHAASVKALGAKVEIKLTADKTVSV